MATPGRPPIGGHRLRPRADNGWRRCSRVRPTGDGRIAVDLITSVHLGSPNRELVFRWLERVNAIDRFALLDAVADLLEDPNSGALVDRCAGHSSQAVEAQAIDAGHDAVVGGENVGFERAQSSLAGRGALSVDDLLHLLERGAA